MFCVFRWSWKALPGRTPGGRAGGRGPASLVGLEGGLGFPARLVWWRRVVGHEVVRPRRHSRFVFCRHGGGCLCVPLGAGPGCRTVRGFVQAVLLCRCRQGKLPLSHPAEGLRGSGARPGVRLRKTRRAWGGRPARPLLLGWLHVPRPVGRPKCRWMGCCRTSLQKVRLGSPHWRCAGQGALRSGWHGRMLRCRQRIKWWVWGPPPLRAASCGPMLRNQPGWTMRTDMGGMLSRRLGRIAVRWFGQPTVSGSLPLQVLGPHRTVFEGPLICPGWGPSQLLRGCCLGPLVGTLRGVHRMLRGRPVWPWQCPL